MHLRMGNTVLKRSQTANGDIREDDEYTSEFHLLPFRLLHHVMQ